MPTKAELMATGLPAATAAKLGLDPLTAFTAAGTTQGTATLLTANFANVSVPSPNLGVILGAPFETTLLYNTGPNTLLIYPPVNGTFVGLSQNAAFTLATANSVIINGDGINFIAVLS
jgi:hypothetical protein